MESKRKILLVEDNPEYTDAAKAHLASKGYEVAHARDYSEAIEMLRNPDYAGVISDCFFPEETGSRKTGLGKELAGNLCPQGRKLAEGLEILGQCVDLSNADMEKYARFLINTSTESDIADNPTIRSIQKASSVLGREAATQIAINTLRGAYGKWEEPKDYYTALIKAMEKSEANQPLGVLVAEKAIELGLPVILATSTNHHDMLTQPVTDYVNKESGQIMFIDCAPAQYQNGQPIADKEEKARPAFWESTLKRLEGKLN